MASDGLARFGISKEDLEKLIREQGEVDSQLNEFMEDEIVPFWKSVSPVDTGNYAASVKVTKKAKNGKGRVAATAWYAHFVEYGTKASDKGKYPRKIKVNGQWRTIDADAATQAQSPAEKTAQHFGGSLGQGGIEFDGGEDQ